MKPPRLTSLLNQYLDACKDDPIEYPKIYAYIMQGVNHYLEQYKLNRALDPIETIKAFYSLIDNTFEASNNEEKKNIRCRKGCNYCCHIDLDINEDEADAIVQYCQDKGIEINTAYLQKQLHVIGRDQTPLSKCEFLKDGACSVYEVRPVNCRKYLVASNPTLCDTRVHSDRIAVFFDMYTEMIASATYNEAARGLMPDMMLKAIEKNNNLNNLSPKPNNNGNEEKNAGSA